MDSLMPVLAATRVDVAVFTVAAVIILGGAIGVITARNPVHSALMLVATLFGIAVLFVAQEAHFLAAVQVIVYAGAIVVLFLFVIMLIGVDREEAVETEPLRFQRPVAVALSLIVLAEVLLLARTSWVTGTPASVTAIDPAAPNVEVLARSIFTTYLFPFEITSVLLVIAVVGAVVMARKPRGQEEEAEESTT